MNTDTNDTVTPEEKPKKLVIPRMHNRHERRALRALMRKKKVKKEQPK